MATVYTTHLHYVQPMGLAFSQRHCCATMCVDPVVGIHYTHTLQRNLTEMSVTNWKLSRRDHDQNSSLSMDLHHLDNASFASLHPVLIPR